MPEPEVTINDDLSGKTTRAFEPVKRSRTRTRHLGGRPNIGFTPDDEVKRKRPRAPEQASMAAQTWYDLGADAGFNFPYDVNYLALQFEKNMETEPLFIRLRKQDREEDVLRLVNKMSDCWWRLYVNGEVNQRNADRYFLVEDWDDVLYYAHSSLRGAYLVEHGRRVKAPEYPDQQKYQDRLNNIRLSGRIAERMRTTEVNPIKPLDLAVRERLRSWGEAHQPEKRTK